jgi:photoactive yellow protein
MSSPPFPSFYAPDVASTLSAMSDADLDRLPFGVIEMDLDCRVLRYNAAESRYSGLTPQRVVGRHFFREVAPCSDNASVSGRFAQDGLDEMTPYVFSLRMKPVPVTLRMLRYAGGQRMHLLVRWS